MHGFSTKFRYPQISYSYHSNIFIRGINQYDDHQFNLKLTTKISLSVKIFNFGNFHIGKQ